MDEDHSRIFVLLDSIAGNITDIKAQNAATSAQMVNLKDDVDEHTKELKAIDRSGWKVLAMLGATMLGWAYALVGK